MKLTKLYPPQTLPVREGVYQLEFSHLPGDAWYSRFDGKKWMFACDTVEAAAAQSFESFAAYRSEFIGWRGMLKP